MPIIPQGLSEIIQDKIVELLIAFSDEQKSIDPLVGFFAVKDRLLNFDKNYDEFPLVNVWLSNLNSQNSLSSNKTYQVEEATYFLDLFAIGLINKEAPPDVEAMARLKYLKEQVKFVILSLINTDFGLPAGTIGKRNWPDFQVFQPDISDTENSLSTGRWRFSVEYSYIPEELTLLDLNQINVDTSMWSALFSYP